MNKVEEKQKNEENVQQDSNDNLENGVEFEECSKAKHCAEKEKKSIKTKLLIFFGIIIGILIATIAVIYFFDIPIVSINGDKIQNIQYGTIYNDSGIKAYSKLRNVTKDVIVESNVDTSALGSYVVEYKVPYKGEYKTYKRFVNVVDTEQPVITLQGDTNVEIEYGSEYEEPGFSASDNYDGDVSESVSITRTDIDSDNFENHYIVTDSCGNKAETVRHIKIIDTTAPEITLNGNSHINVVLGSTYKEQGATANDNKDGELSNNIVIDGEVDTNKEGNYKITYSVEDHNGNKTTKTREVKVTDKKTAGVIYLTFDDGPSKITPQILDILKEKGVKATFFVINYSDENEKLIKREIEEGHSVGIHGYSHDYAKIYKSLDDCYNNIISLQDKIYNATGVKTMIVRFPGGSSNTVSRKYCPGIMTQITKKVLDNGFKYFDWNVASGDSGDVNTKEAVYSNVTRGIKPGRNNIVLMHDFAGNNKTLQALSDIIDYGLSNGYSFEAIDTDTEMITQKVQN